MPTSREALARSAEALVAGLARTGDPDAFAELVSRRQAWIRNLLRRCCGDPQLADDLAQQAFLQAWRDIRKLRQPNRFGPWLKQLAVNVWRQHARRNDVMDSASALDAQPGAAGDAAGLGRDLDRALATLEPTPRLCVVLSYHEGLSHSEIAALTGLAPGTVKSHIRRGSQQLKTLLADYRDTGTS